VSFTDDARAKRSVWVIAFGILGIVRALVAFKVFNMDLSSFDASDVVNILLVFGLAGGTVWIGLKALIQRIKDGLSLHHSDPPIQPPSVITTVKQRLTFNNK